jgi:hypothetical protein
MAARNIHKQAWSEPDLRLFYGRMKIRVCRTEKHLAESESYSCWAPDTGRCLKTAVEGRSTACG